MLHQPWRGTLRVSSFRSDLWSARILVFSSRMSPILSHPLRRSLLPLILIGALLLGLGAVGSAQSTATLQGKVVDPAGAVVAGVRIVVRNRETGVERVAQTDSEGNYQVAALPVGIYRVKIQVPGFQTQVVESLIVEVARTVVQDFQLEVGDISQEVTVTSDGNLVERTTVSVGHVIDQRMVQEIPLNGRYFLDLGLLVPGSVTPPQNGFSAIPVRGSGAFAINTAGNREETVNYMINGITLNNLRFSSISFQPSISTVQEFKVDNSTFSAEYGQSSGAIVNIATRSGANEFHGELFEFLRNDALDARNFFNFTSSEPPPFKRNQFGGQSRRPHRQEHDFLSSSLTRVCAIGRGSISTASSSAMPSARRVTDPVIVEADRADPASELRRFIGHAALHRLGDRTR